jgi:glutathione S-transferase
LLYTPIAGYVHTVEAVINYCELRDRIAPVPTKPFDADTSLQGVNPLGKVPTLVLPSGEYLAGGPVIYEYLDSLHRRRRLFPAKGPQRWTTLRQAWMADGLFDTFVQMIIESWLPREAQRPVYHARCWGKVVAILDQMERDVPSYGRIDIGQMRTVGALTFVRSRIGTVAAASGAIDANFDVFAGRPQLAAWFKPMARKKIFREPLQAIGS